uniref:C-type lectin domain-containing protein n=1 Tax=Panagrellus redivivus TaxID=6233 RepID=A0A7E5A0T8_PANRE
MLTNGVHEQKTAYTRLPVINTRKAHKKVQIYCLAMRPLFVLLIFLVQSFSQSYTNFIHLLGWTLNANVLKQYATSNTNDCGTECALTVNCTGFQMLHGTGQCNLLTMMRSYNFNVSQCGFYLKQSANVTVSGRTLTSNIDKVLQNAVYDSQLICPDGWEGVVNYQWGLSKCVLALSQSVCNQYASFLQATYSGGDCLMPYFKVTYSCPDSTFTLGNYTDGKYCLKVISKWSNDTDIGNMKLYEFANQYCYAQTGGYLVSIHSAAENSAINTLQKKLDTTGAGVMIGLVADSSTVMDVNDLHWLDGTGMSYTNYANFIAGNFTYSLMTTAGQWQIQYDPDVEGSIFQYIACKRSVTATMS